MKRNDILTDASTWTKEDFDKHGRSLVAGCASTNPNFNFSGTSYTDYKTSFENWVDLNTKAEISGDKVKIEKAGKEENAAKANYKIIAKQVNVQAGHNKAKLQSSGGVLIADGAKLGILKQAVIKKITSKVVNQIEIVIFTYSKSVGTVICWKDLTAGTPAEYEFFAQKHIIILDELISGHQYEIMVAHKGSVRKVLYSHSVKIWVQ